RAHHEPLSAVLALLQPAGGDDAVARVGELAVEALEGDDLPDRRGRAAGLRAGDAIDGGQEDRLGGIGHGRLDGRAPPPPASGPAVTPRASGGGGGGGGGRGTGPDQEISPPAGSGGGRRRPPPARSARRSRPAPGPAARRAAPRSRCRGARRPRPSPGPCSR